MALLLRHNRAPVLNADVDRVYAAWERERHYLAKRHIYPGVLDTLQRIKEDQPNAIIGAVTDGKASPLRTVFTLAPYFNFYTSWEDDAAGRTDFFQELSDADGEADLRWIYRAAHATYAELAGPNAADAAPPAWIHVGDDLAYDVGGGAAGGARTILLDLDAEYGQTANRRFLEGGAAVMPAWNTASAGELAKRKAMNDAAEALVNRRIARLALLPAAIDEILRGA